MSVAITQSNSNTKKYFQVERVLLKVAGVSLENNESRAYKMYSWLALFMFNFTYPFVASVDLFKQNFNDAIDSWFYVFGTFMALAMTFSTFRNRYKLGLLLNKLEEEPFLANTERGGDTEEKLIKGWLSFNYKQVITFVVGVMVSLISQMIYTFFKRIMSSDFHDWSTTFAHITLINMTYSPNYEIIMLYQSLSITYMSVNACCTTLIISGTLAHVSTQFKMLQNTLHRLVPSSSKKVLQLEDTSAQAFTEADFSNIPWEYLNTAIENAVSYHLSIIQVAAELEEIFNPTMLSIYTFTLIVVCLEVYRASLLASNDMRTYRVLFETITACFHAFMICFSGEQMAHESQEVARAAYETNFVGTDTRFQKSLVIIIRRSQKPLRIKAGQLIETSLVTFAGILRASYSAYMLLRKMNLQDDYAN